MPALFPWRAGNPAGAPGQRIALGLVVQFGEPGPAQGVDSGALHHRGLLVGEVWLHPEDATETPQRGSGDRPGSGAAGLLDSRGGVFRMARGAAGRLVRPPQRLAPGWRPELAQDAADVHASGFRLIYSSAPIWAFVRPAASSSTANSRPVSPCGARVSAGGGVLMTPAAG